VASSQGTSAQVVTGDTEKLYINVNGKAVNYLVKRLKHDRKEKGKSLEGAMDLDEQERNALFIYQIPLKQNPCAPSRGGFCSFKNQSLCLESCSISSEIYEDDCEEDDYEMFTNRVKEKSRSTKSIGMDNAVLRVGNTHSTFKGVGSFSLERDDRYPVRCTIQFYKVTDDDNIHEEVFQEMREKIDSV